MQTPYAAFLYNQESQGQCGLIFKFPVIMSINSLFRLIQKSHLINIFPVNSKDPQSPFRTGTWEVAWLAFLLLWFCPHFIVVRQIYFDNSPTSLLFRTLSKVHSSSPLSSSSHQPSPPPTWFALLTWVTSYLLTLGEPWHKTEAICIWFLLFPLRFIHYFETRLSEYLTINVH